jgi:hypothetical protein
MKSEDVSPRLLESATCPMVSQMSPVHGLPTNFLVIADHFVINDWSTQSEVRGRGGEYAIVSGIVAVSLLKLSTYFPK